MSIKPYELQSGNCKELIKQLADNTIDAIVTDPPYELGFMGKKWDATGIAYDAELWRECLRVLKPGGHLLAFSGSRTYHRMAVAIEDAGFDIRDQIMWVYGSGFPKSHDVSKAIDKKRDDNQEACIVAEFLLRHNTCNTVTEFREMLNREIIGETHSGGSAQGWTTIKIDGVVKPRVPTWEQWGKLKNLLKFSDEMDAEVWRLNNRKGKPGEAWGMREVLGNVENGGLGKGNFTAEKIGAGGYGFDTSYNITAPATEAAKEWNGWGTALKPAHEPICVARKPLIGTVAENVLQYGTGALNIDGCRVGSEPIKQRVGKNPLASFSKNAVEQNFRPIDYYANDHKIYVSGSASGRWPANLIHDGSAEVLAGFPINVKGQIGMTKDVGNFRFIAGDLHTVQKFTTGITDSGSAARFFYCAKASKRDRDEGNDKNNHPTVKPTDLMRYLCRLITPPNGLILDPFTGSGSTGKAAILEGFRFLGFEMEPQYIEIATARIEYAIEQKSKQKTEQENTLFGANNE